MTGLAVESIYFENVDKNPSKIVELFDWSASFLTMHTSETERLFDADLPYFSPMLMVAFNLTPDQVMILKIRFFGGGAGEFF
jgi:hypothetical protein